jgi:hypothetical protein
MSTPKPKFSVGEVVIRHAPSTNYPEHNGEYTILGIVHVGQLFKGFPSVIWYYELENLSIHLHCGFLNVSNEKFLRKKHQKGEMSYTELMASCKIPSKAHQ